MLSDKQVACLADAEAAINRTGLERMGGDTWKSDQIGSLIHAGPTVRSLIDRGCLRYWAAGTVVHITDLGLEALEVWRVDNGGAA